MSVGTRLTAIAHDGHVVHFYERESQLVDTVCSYLAEALGAGETAVIIATDAHRRSFEAELRARGAELDRAAADGRLVLLDADATLAAFSDDGNIDPQAFRAVLGTLLRDALASGRALRAYGEMVALLWDRGNVLAAIELEELWNELGRELSFSLLCSYASASVAASEHRVALERVRREHSREHARLLERPLAEAGERDERSDPSHEHAGAAAEAGVSASFPAEPGSPGRARKMATATLRRWGHDESLVEDVSLVVSELASNAVRHAGSVFSLALESRGALLRVAVEDRSPLAGSVPGGGLDPQPPHGLCVVDSLTRSWGVEPTRDGKVVWAQLTCAAPPGPRA